MQTVIQTFLYIFYILINKINWYLLTHAIIIVIRNGKIAWKVVWVEYYLRLNSVIRNGKIVWKVV